MAEKPFKIAVSDNQLNLLRKKLDMTRFPDELEAAGLDYGAPLADVRRLVEYWIQGFDWRLHEAKLNEELPQFTRDIDIDGHGTLNIHYVHKKSKSPDAIPLVFVHGWPGSFLEVRKLLPYLAEVSPYHPSFHVVALSLPGYGFSEASKKRGFAIAQMAEAAHKLMLSLGYNEYVAQGGDWGSAISGELALRYGPKHVKAWHTNFPMGTQPHPIHSPGLFIRSFLFGLTQKEREGLQRTEDFWTTGNGYFKEQATQPQTLGYGLADSPAGLLAWIYEKLYRWTDEYPWTDDEVLTWISIYWFSRAGPAASVRIYFEFAKANPDPTATESPVTKAITGYSYFPKEIINLPRSWYTYGRPNVKFESDHDKGGHFAAYEVPDALAMDLRKMFGKGGPAFGVVPGRAGYP